MARRRKAEVVGEIVPSPALTPVLDAVAGRVQSGETLALAVVEYRRGGIVGWDKAGFEAFRHQLVAGAVYLLDDLKGESD